MNPFHFFTRAAVEEFERRFTQFLIHNPLFQSFAHHSSKKVKELSSKVGEDMSKAALQAAKKEAERAASKFTNNLRK